jgi:hypothetical protein
MFVIIYLACKLGVKLITLDNLVKNRIQTKVHYRDLQLYLLFAHDFISYLHAIFQKTLDNTWLLMRYYNRISVIEVHVIIN